MGLQLDTVAIVLLAIIIAFFASVLLVDLVAIIKKFSHERECLNREIARSEGAEREYWKREKRRLWLSLLPFCRK